MAVLLAGLKSLVARVWHGISFYYVCVCGWGYGRSTASERKADQGRHGLARMRG